MILLHEVQIAGLTMDPSSNTPIIILKSVEDDRAIPIWIGLLEATSIASALQGVKFERPMTHDLFKNYLEMRRTRVTRVEVCDLKGNTFFAKIYFTNKEEEFHIDARPSDAIAIALRFKAPIFVEDSVIEQSEVADQKPEAADESEEGKKWAEYLEKLDPDEFGKT